MLNQDILIYINGEPFTCSKLMKLVDVLYYLDFDIRLVTVEYNTEIIPKSLLSTLTLNQNDKIEIITIVGGG